MMDRERKWKIYFHDLDKNKCGEWSEPYILQNVTYMYICQGKCYKKKSTTALLNTYYEHCIMIFNVFLSITLAVLFKQHNVM